MRRAIQLSHTIYTLTWFVVSFLLIFPFYIIFSFNKNWHRFAYSLDHYWGLIYFPLCFFKTQIEFEGTKPGKGPVIYCANHFSTIDIPSLALLPKQACYVGKESIKKIPLFGYMFRTLHITVNRSSLKDRGRVYQKYKEAIEEGKSLFIYPEGGITSTNFPTQSTYKEGAFRVAIEQQIPIVPITIPNNWKVLPDGDWLIKENFVKLIVHEPIETAGLTHEDVRNLKDKVWNLIQNKINKENNVENSRANSVNTLTT